MKPIYLPLFTLLLFACRQTTPENHAPPENTLSAQEIAEGWQLLFDGKSLDKWRGYARSDLPANGWSIRDAALVIEKTPDPKPDDFGGDIITKDQFGGFELMLDFMLSSEANSGIFYFVVEAGSLPIWANAPEYQLLDNAGYQKANPDADLRTHCSCDNYDIQAAPDSFLKPVGEWNQARIVHDGEGHVTHWLNGKKCVEYVSGSPEWEAMVAQSKFKDYPLYGRSLTGHIGLQDHQHEVHFKNIKIRSLK